MPATTDLTKTLKDAAYIAVGLGVIGFQKAQVRRHELTKQVAGQRKDWEAQLHAYRGQLEVLAQDVDARIAPVVATLEERVAPVLDQLEDRLPGQAKELVSQARTAAKDARAELRKALVPASAPA